MFDFNKLDLYKPAIDDGARFEFETEIRGIVRNVKIEVCHCCIKETIYNFDVNYGFVVNLNETDWETFKKKVADYFLGADEK